MAADRLHSDVHMMNNADNYITSLASCNNGTEKGKKVLSKMNRHSQIDRK
jgi:hypothetical protein